MKEKKYATRDLYILHVSELIYLVPDGEICYSPDTMYEREYYTVAERKKENKYRDVFEFKTYKKEGIVGLGTIREIKEPISIDELTGFMIPSMTKKDALISLKNYLITLNPENDIEISVPKKYTKNMDLNLRPQLNK